MSKTANKISDGKVKSCKNYRPYEYSVPSAPKGTYNEDACRRWNEMMGLTVQRLPGGGLKPIWRERKYKEE